MRLPLIGVIVNPNALGVRREPGLARRLEQIVGGHGEVIETRSTAELEGATRRLADRGVEIVATCGGDGTNLHTLSELVRYHGASRLPTIAILRGGTVNTIAENLRIKGRPTEILERLVAAVRAGELPTVGQDLLQVDERYGFLFAALMGARFLQAYYDGPASGRWGPAWAGFLAARVAASSLVTGRLSRQLFAPTEVALELDGRPNGAVPRPRLLLASTVPDVGIGMKVAWQAGRQPNRFHLVASGLSTVSMALQLHKVLAGRPLDGGPHLDVLAQTARVRFAADEPFTLDGELFSGREVELRVGPRIWIARP